MMSHTPPDETRFVHVLDAGADNYEVYCHLLSQRAGWVVRAAQHHRMVVDDGGPRVALNELLPAQAVAGTYELSLRARQGQKARTAKVEVRFAPVTMPCPHSASPWVRRYGAQAIDMWVVEVHEIGAPRGMEPLHWLLLTSEPVRTFEAAWKIIGWYEKTVPGGGISQVPENRLSRGSAAIRRQRPAGARDRNAEHPGSPSDPAEIAGADGTRASGR